MNLPHSLPRTRALASVVSALGFILVPVQSDSSCCGGLPSSGGIASAIPDISQKFDTKRLRLTITSGSVERQVRVRTNLGQLLALIPVPAGSNTIINRSFRIPAHGSLSVTLEPLDGQDPNLPPSAEVKLTTGVERVSGDGTETVEEECPPKVENIYLDSSGDPKDPLNIEQVFPSDLPIAGEEPGNGEADNDAEDPSGSGGAGWIGGDPPSTLYESFLHGLRQQIGAVRIRIGLGTHTPPLIFAASDIGTALEGTPSDWRKMLFAPMISADAAKIEREGDDFDICHTRFKGKILTEKSVTDPFKIIRSMHLEDSEVVVNVLVQGDELALEFTDTRQRIETEENPPSVSIVNGRYTVSPARDPYVRWVFSKVENDTWFRVRTTEVAGRDPSQRERSWRYQPVDAATTRMVNEQTGVAEDFIYEDGPNQTYTRGEIVTTPAGITSGWKAVAFGSGVAASKPAHQDGVMTVHYGGSENIAWEWASNGMFEKTSVAPALLAPNRTITVLRPWGNTVNPDNATLLNSHAVVTTEVPLTTGRAKTCVEMINGIANKWTVDTKVAAISAADPVIHEVRQRYPNGFNSVPLIDYTRRHKRDGLSQFSGRPIYEQRSDGTTVDYSYLPIQNFHESPDRPNIAINRTSTAPDGIVRRESIVEDGAGRTIQRSSFVVVHSVSHLVSATRHTYSDIDGGVKMTERWNQGTEAWERAYERIFDGDQLDEIVEIDDSGVVTTHSDIRAHEIPWESTRAGYAVGNVTYVPEQKITRTYDEDGNLLTETILGPDPNNPAQIIPLQTRNQTYYNDGRLWTERVNGIVTTIYEYATSGAGGEQVKTFRQSGTDGGTKALISERVTDWTGHIVSVSGPEVIAESNSYEPLSSGRIRVTSIKGSGNATIVNKRELDGLGRVVAEDIPGTNPITQKTYFFDGFGRRTEEKIGGVSAVTWQYNGSETTQTTKAFPDVNQSVKTYHEVGEIAGMNDVFWEITRDSQWESRTQLTGLPTNVLAVHVSGPPGNTSLMTRTVISRSANGLVTQSVKRPSAVNPSISQSFAGLTTYTEAHTGDPGTTYFYDALGRPQEIKDFSDARVVKLEYEAVYGQQYRITTRTEPQSVSSVITNIYFAPDTAQRGRLLSSYTNGLTTSFAWAARGDLLAQWGANYPVKYEYDDAGRLWKMHTYRTEPSGNDPAAWTGGDVTEWIYYPGTNLLQKKKDAVGKGASYTYDTRGRTWVRTWERTVNGQPLTTTYTYNDANQLRNINYSDTTPDVTIGRNAKGQVTTVTDGEGMRTYERNADGTIGSETLPGIGQGGAKIQYGYDDFGRRHNYAVWDGASWVTWQSWGFDASTGRYSGINTPDGWIPFSYDNQKGLFTGWTVPGGAGPINVTRSYDNLGRIVSAQTTVNGNPAVSRIYGYDAQHRRSSLLDETAETWNYTYNGRNELRTGTKTYVDSTNTTRTVPGMYREYHYDAIGNRTKYHVNENDRPWTPNTLNQIASREPQGKQYVLGQAAPSPASVSVTAQGDQVYAAPTNVTVARGLPPKAEKFAATIDTKVKEKTKNLKVTIQENNNGTVTEDIGHVFVPGSPEGFTYDADGNLTQDGRWNYTWDAENRLIGMETRSDITVYGPDALPKLRLIFKYDAFSRRVSKKVEQTNVSGVYEQASFGRFVYDGWNLLAEWRANPIELAIVGTYNWSEYTSDEVKGFGNVGGLVVYRASQSARIPCYDGNGNIIAILDGQTDALDASFAYGPFGESIRESNPEPGKDPFRWNTKYADSETGLLYYGYRFYSTASGRWINRDPIDEQGGLNLYAFVVNAPSDSVDPLGLQVAVGHAANEKCNGHEKSKGVGFSIPNGDSRDNAMFDRIAAHGGAWWIRTLSANTVLQHLKTVTSENCCNCVSIMTWAGHGFGPSRRGKEGLVMDPDLSNWTDFSGMETGIKEGSIRFCKECTIQIYSCRTSEATIQKLSKITGCKVVAASGSCSPDGATGKWTSGPKTWDEKTKYPYNGFLQSTGGGQPVPTGEPFPNVSSGSKYIPIPK